ncbi:hypothetical protein [Robiginitalea aurantiaca]|uniref:SRPBCC family protein n=1 Tax=Robiginitalea aurantiaca TaxID=3056915 RepID=A0ABT7WGW0_9FLAO|nr:hypothetical protein [Robiginitalea aurantiaca]MDM9632155.1 hypothetical protein [Robiginitalea aurantiaca]
MDQQVNLSAGPLNGELTIIELRIKNAKKLFANPSDWQSYCRLADNSGKNSDGIKLKDFESVVFPDSVVLWLGKFTKNKDRKGYSLSLDAIEINGVNESEIFEGTLQIGSGKGILAWTRSVFVGNPEEKYNLVFTLTDDEGNSKQIRIDPKLKPGTQAVYQILLNYISKIGDNVALRTALIETYRKFIKGS